MTSLYKLKLCKSLADLAELLNLKPQTVSFILYKIPEDNKYRPFPIPKKNGDFRIIQSPDDRLKGLQRRLADLLADCFEELTKDHRPLSHGFRKDCSIISNAKKHRNKRHVFNIDLKDFFPSINFGRVRGFFITNKHFQLDPKVATIIAQIACHKNELPQGSPCSPIISNLLGHILDIKMVKLAKDTKCTYSRYVDDLTFSTNKAEFPEDVAIQVSDSDWIIGDKLLKAITKQNFLINENKISMQHKTRRQVATGLVVNTKVNIKKEYYRQARSMCHTLFQHGFFYKPTLGLAKQPDNSAGEPDSVVHGRLKQLEGILSYIYTVKGPHDLRDTKAKRSNPSGIMRLYRTFLFYKHFFALGKPLIVCEGKTDLIYLRCALKQLHLDYNELIDKTNEGFNFKVRFLRLSPLLKEIFAISEGTSGLASLMEMYGQYMQGFKGDGKKYPVIILVDNDSGSKQIKSNMNRKSFPGKFKSLYLDNLYIVTLPSALDGTDIEIEDLFDLDVLATALGGKTFSRKSKSDNNQHYSKAVFAEKVIKPKQNLINFDGFKAILDQFVEVIQHHHVPAAQDTLPSGIILPPVLLPKSQLGICGPP